MVGPLGETEASWTANKSGPGERETETLETWEEMRQGSPNPNLGGWTGSRTIATHNSMEMDNSRSKGRE